jgi:nucleoside-diphosphate-sugar epimerase
MSDRFLVTGALGCMGAWILRTLVREGVPAVDFDRDGPRRLELERLTRLIYPSNLAGMTGLVMPCGFSSEGLTGSACI